MLFQEIRQRLGVMKLGFRQWSSAIEVGSVYIRAVRDQQFGNGALVRMRRCMQRSRTPVVVVISRVNISART